MENVHHFFFYETENGEALSFLLLEVSLGTDVSSDIEAEYKKLKVEEQKDRHQWWKGIMHQKNFQPKRLVERQGESMRADSL